MPRARGSEIAQRVSTRGQAPLRTSSSESDPLHHRPMTDRSPKLRSPRNAQSEPVNQKKLGTRIAGLESQLEQAQGELKILKDQLASAEAAKKQAQKELEKKITKPAASDQDSRFSPSENKEPGQEIEIPDENDKETDVFEVPVEIVNPEPNSESPEKPVTILPESPEKSSLEETLAAKNEEINSLKLTLQERDTNLKALDQENTSLKHQLHKANSEISSAKVKEHNTNSKLDQLQGDKIQLTEKLKEAEGAKQALETEMKKLRVQTEQWRKAADAAAAVLSGAPDGRRVSERCGSMHYGGVYEGFVGSPGLGDESDDGKRKGSGIRMFGDLWKKKGQK